MANFRNAFFAKAFRAEEGVALAARVIAAYGRPIEDFPPFTGEGAHPPTLAGRRVVIIDHPPTAGLLPLIEGLQEAGAEVHLRDHHDTPRDTVVVAAVREHLGVRAVVATREEYPACSMLVEEGEFREDVILADADPDGVLGALKAIGVWYDAGDQDAAVLDGPAAGQTEERLSPLGFAFRRAWGALPPFGDRARDAVMGDIVTALAAAIRGEADGHATLERFALEYEAKVAASHELAATAEQPFDGFRIVEVPAEARYDAPTLAAALDRGVLVSARVVSTGPIAGQPGGFGRQVSLARTKAGEAAGIDLAALAEAAFGPRPESGWGPADGVISNTPFLLHLSPERWRVFRHTLKGVMPRTRCTRQHCGHLGVMEVHPELNDGYLRCPNCWG